jgi:hypothetical protein
MWTKSKVSFIETYVFNSPLIKAVSVPLNPTIHPPYCPRTANPCILYMQEKNINTGGIFLQQIASFWQDFRGIATAITTMEAT